MYKYSLFKVFNVIVGKEGNGLALVSSSSGTSCLMRVISMASVYIHIYN